MAAVGTELSDDELHQRLIEIGVTNCPVTASTRKVLLKKYGRELMSQSKVSKSLNNRKTPVQLGFSSDEGEDFEGSPKRTPPNHKFRRKSTAKDATPKSSRRYSSPVDSDFKKPASQPRRSTRKSLIPESSNSIAGNGNAADTNGDVGRRRRTRSSNKVNMLYDMNISDSDNDLNSPTNKFDNAHSSHPQNVWTRRKSDKLNSSPRSWSVVEDNDIFRTKRPARADSPSSGLQTSNIQNHERITSKNYEPDEEGELILIINRFL